MIFDFKLLLSTFPPGECQLRHQETGCCHHRWRRHTRLPRTPLPEEEGQEEGHLTAVGESQLRVLLLSVSAERYDFLTLVFFWRVVSPQPAATHSSLIST